MSSGHQPDQRGPALLLVFLLMVGLIVIAWGVNHPSQAETPAAEQPAVVEQGVAPAPSAGQTPAARPSTPVPVTLPGGGTRIFAGHRFLVAYYGTAGNGALGVLGETDPDTMDRRLRRAARPFARPGRPVQKVYELIVTVADGHPGRGHDYSHDISHAAVRGYIRAAHRNHALLLLDLQPGRSSFLDTARRWEWALRDPWVGLALDPEWRMGPHQVPARTVGHVGAAEVNRTAAWLARLTRHGHLPQKLFVVHQFRVAMIRNIDQVGSWPELAKVQHVDGFGNRHEKLATYHRVARPHQFTMGFKLFYDEDVHRMGAREVHRIRPRVRFVSFQ